jgi:hypothetical protein
MILVASPSVELIGISFVSQMTESSSFSHILHHRACERTLHGSYAGSMIVETISSVEDAPINSRSEGTVFTSTQDEPESSNLRMSHYTAQVL